MHTRRPGRLSGATAQRVLDGDAGPSPLPQLIAAATGPATAAELRGESAARAAFRASVHSVPLPDDLSRRPPVRITTSIMIAKAIAAVALTASTAGGIALATTSAPADPGTRATTGSAADAASSSLSATPTPTGAALADADPAADATEAGRASSGTAIRTTPGAEAAGRTSTAGPAHPTGLCRAAANITTAGKATASPPFADLNCTEDGAGGPGAATSPAARPTAAPGNPEQRTGRPDGAGNATNAGDTGDTGDEAEKPGEAGGHGDAARADDGDTGRAGGRRQDG